MTVKDVKLSEKALKRNLITLKKPTALEKIIDTIPKPNGAVPNFGLPKWKLMPFESKIPMIPGPEGAYNFTRQKLGKKLWVQTKNAEFNLNDPCNYELQLSYDSMHDEHLTRYFSRLRNINRMVEHGFVTGNLDAKCSLKDYNMYRKFLMMLHRDNINQEFKRRSDLDNERRILEFADFAARRDIERSKIAERKILARDRAMQERNQREAGKENEARKKSENLKQRKLAVELAKRKEMQMRVSKAKAQAEYAKRRKELALENKQREVIETRLAWAMKTARHKKLRKQQLCRKIAAKRRALAKKWQQRIQQEEKEIAIKQLALQYAEQQREAFIKNYKKKVERQKALMQRQFKKIQRFVRCYAARKASGRKKLRCCKKLQGQKKGSKFGQKKKSTI